MGLGHSVRLAGGRRTSQDLQAGTRALSGGVEVTQGPRAGKALGAHAQRTGCPLVSMFAGPGVIVTLSLWGPCHPIENVCIQDYRVQIT